ncbi:tetratricopeptide repeat-containing sensor histidine kinase [Pontibacter pamirensis]|uniref:tetratricopeptide repeat-containing sensor histidine kinase n=1 Tax=Pontibacter pamirensis TaxID=2562824 RepID=UPI0013896580|nr:tetratricopeptide repeat protein [Pontibacter pamirensis]
MQKIVLPSVAEATKNKVDALNGKARELMVIDSNQALVLSQEAVRLAEGIVYLQGEAEGLRIWGFCHIRRSEHDKAVYCLEKAFPLFQATDDLKGQADIWQYKGIIKRCQGNYALSLECLFKALATREKLSNQEDIPLNLYDLGITYKYLGSYSKALDYLLKSLQEARKIKATLTESYVMNNIGLIYYESNDFYRALSYYQQSLSLRKLSGDQWGEAGCLDNIGTAYYKLEDHEKALTFCQQSLAIAESIGDKKGQGNALFHIGSIHFKLKDFEQARLNWVNSQQIRAEIQDKKGQADILFCFSELYSDKEFLEANTEKAIGYLNEGVHLGEDIKAKDTLSKIHKGYYQVLKQSGDYQEALVHYEKHIALDKEIYSEAMSKKVIDLEITHGIEKAIKEMEAFRIRNTELAKLNEEIQEQKERTELQRDVLRKALTDLKATQSQLVQSEKMASLGELTAGIAHEIQNPLNFVNNFSEVSVELCAEIGQEIESSLLEEAQTTLADLVQNLYKIQEHGRRAEAIVKGMLQHSRNSTGQKELTDLNALANEYMRLAYHGLRAKDQSFNTALITHLDDKLQKIRVVPQEIGRVLLNLFNNAFYAVQQKQKQAGQEYKPEVRVMTRQLRGRVEVRVCDNGTGIPQKVKAKLFQPFFTTKPSGQGTGLGLSLSYDIITKGHRGKLQVKSQEGKFTEFIIRLPFEKPADTAE